MNRPILAVLAACLVLCAGAAAVFAPQVAVAQSLSGEWRGQGSGNVVMITDQGGSLYVAAVTNNANQSAPMVFNRTGPGEYRYTFPDGNQAVVRMEGSNMRMVTPDGWTDLFIPANRPAPAAPTYSSAPAAPAAPSVDPSVDPGIMQAMAQADAASRDALEAAMTPPVTAAPGASSFASSSPSATTTPTPASTTSPGRGPSAAYQQGGDCVTMKAREDGGGWAVFSTCSYRAYGAWCYEDDGVFSCAKKMKGGFGPLPAATSEKPTVTSNVSASPRNGAKARWVWCDYEDWVKGTCDGNFEPWTAGTPGG